VFIRVENDVENGTKQKRR